MRRLVTGATGFIGTHLVRRLVGQGGEVHAVIRRETADAARARLPAGIVCHSYDGTTESVVALMERARPDTVFHLASLALSEHATAQVRPLVESNILFPTQLLEAMALCGVRRLVNMGSAWQHFGSRAYSPTGLYAATKQAFEAIVRFYAEARGLNAITFKLFHAYGPGDARPRLMTELVRAARTGAHLPMSPGEQIVDLVHIDDAIEALLSGERRLAQGGTHGAESFALASGRPLRVREVALLFERTTGRRLDIGWGERPYKEREMMDPCDMGQPLPGWAPTISLEEGIAGLWAEEGPGPGR